MVCPAPITIDTEPGQSYATIVLPEIGDTSRGEIFVSDNSNVAPQIIGYVPGETNQVFSIGRTDVVVMAEDESENVASCTLQVIVLGRYRSVGDLKGVFFEHSPALRCEIAEYLLLSGLTHCRNRMLTFRYL